MHNTGVYRLPIDQRLTSLDADQSASLLTLLYKNRTPFVFSKYGDGYLECVYGLRQGETRDGEQYTAGLAEAIHAAWTQIQSLHGDGLGSARMLIIADWSSAHFNKAFEGLYPEQYRQFLGNTIETAIFVDYECLLIDRYSEDLLGFYRAVRADKDRRKVLLGPPAWAEGAKMLRAVHIPTPLSNLFDHVTELEQRIMDEDPDVILYGAGMAGTIPITNVLLQHPFMTAVNIGSALDPLFRGHTRLRQLQPARARRLFAGLLCE